MCYGDCTEKNDVRMKSSHTVCQLTIQVVSEMVNAGLKWVSREKP